MKWKGWASLGFTALIIAGAVGQVARGAAPEQQGLVPVATTAQGSGGQLPMFEVDAAWPKPLPNDWTLGVIGGIGIDYSNDHIWIANRTNTLAADEMRLLDKPPSGVCCKPAPPILEFDAQGNLLQTWGGPGPGYEWPTGEHGLFIDHKGNVWIAGNGKDDSHVVKFTKQGKFIMQLGKKGQNTGGSNNLENFARPTKIQVSAKTNEVFIADGYTNRRVIVFDADTGKYKRHWTAFGNKPDDAAPKERGNPDGASPQQFNLVHGLRLSNDDIMYVADRLNNRVQSFKPDGTFLKEGFTRRNTLGNGAAYDVDLSTDPQQRFVYVADGTNNYIWIMDRPSLQVIGHIGRQGRMAGQFHHIHQFAVDTKGNIYAGETVGHRVQRFVYKGMAAAKAPTQ